MLTASAKASSNTLLSIGFDLILVSGSQLDWKTGHIAPIVHQSLVFYILLSQCTYILLCIYLLRTGIAMVVAFGTIGAFMFYWNSWSLLGELRFPSLCFYTPFLTLLHISWLMTTGGGSLGDHVGVVSSGEARAGFRHGGAALPRQPLWSMSWMKRMAGDSDLGLSTLSREPGACTLSVSLSSRHSGAQMRRLCHCLGNCSSLMLVGRLWSIQWQL